MVKCGTERTAGTGLRSFPAISWRSNKPHFEAAVESDTRASLEVKALRYGCGALYLFGSFA
jgi:hypothetical protein